MTIEGGSRRIATLLSLTALSSGVLFTVLLAAASAWSLHLERQERARLEAEGRPLTPEDERRAVLPAVEVAGPNRWRVILGERPPTAGRWPYRAGAYVIIAGRQLTEVEVLEAARASDRDRGSTDLARWHPSPGVEVIDCVMESVEISRARYATAVSSQLIDWWTEQGARLYLRSWMNVLPLARWVFVAGTLISALMLTAIAAGLPWGCSTSCAGSRADSRAWNKKIRVRHCNEVCNHHCTCLFHLFNHHVPYRLSPEPGCKLAGVCDTSRRPCVHC